MKRGRNIVQGHEQLIAAQLLVDDPAALVSLVKHKIQQKEGIPVLQQRLTFDTDSAGTQPPGCLSDPQLSPDNLSINFAEWQAIVFQNEKSVGRLITPRVSFRAEDSHQQGRFEFLGLPFYLLDVAYDTWQPVSKTRKALDSARPLHIAGNEDFQASGFELKLVVKGKGGTPFCPGSFIFSGKKTIAAASLLKQQQEYIRSQQDKHGALQIKSSEVAASPLAEIRLLAGSQLQSFTLAFATDAEPLFLKQITFSISCFPAGGSGSLYVVNHPSFVAEEFISIAPTKSASTVKAVAPFTDMAATATCPDPESSGQMDNRGRKPRKKKQYDAASVGSPSAPEAGAALFQDEESSHSPDSPQSGVLCTVSCKDVQAAEKVAAAPDGFNAAVGGQAEATTACSSGTNGNGGQRGSGGSKSGGAGDSDHRGGSDELSDGRDGPAGQKSPSNGGSGGDRDGSGDSWRKNGNNADSDGGKLRKREPTEEESEAEATNDTNQAASSTRHKIADVQSGQPSSSNTSAVASTNSSPAQVDVVAEVRGSSSSTSSAAADSSSSQLAGSTPGHRSGHAPFQEEPTSSSRLNGYAELDRKHIVNGKVVLKNGRYKNGTLLDPSSDNSAAIMVAQLHSALSGGALTPQVLRNALGESNFSSLPTTQGTHSRGSSRSPRSVHSPPALASPPRVSRPSSQPEEQMWSVQQPQDSDALQEVGSSLANRPQARGAVPPYRPPEQRQQEYRQQEYRQQEYRQQEYRYPDFRQQEYRPQQEYRQVDYRQQDYRPQQEYRQQEYRRGRGVPQGPSANGYHMRASGYTPRQGPGSRLRPDADSAAAMRLQGTSPRVEGSGEPASNPSSPSASSVEGMSQRTPGPASDLERFLVQVTPMLNLDQSGPVEQAIRNLCLEDVWRFYCEPSLYGREVYTLGGQRGPSWSYFVPYMSAMQLFIPASPGDPATNRMYVSDVEGWPKHMYLLFEYFEKELPFNRSPMYDMIEMLVRSPGTPGAALQEQKICQLHPASWFAVAWYPVYRIPDAPLTARFLTFHSFAPLIGAYHNTQSALEKGMPRIPHPSVVGLQVVGLKWYNMQSERWMENLTEAEGNRQRGADVAAAAASSSGVGSSGSSARGVRKPSSPSMDVAWQAHLSELQSTAERLSRGIGLRILGQMGAEDAKLWHSDFEFFDLRGS